MAAITLRKARSIIRGAQARAKEAEMKPLAVVVLDPGGHVIAAEREDGASVGRVDVAIGKAYGALMLGIGGRAQMARAEAQAYFMASANGLFGGKMIPVPGGVLVRDAKGALIGAVGASGEQSENDEAACIAGVEAAGYRAEP